MGSYLNICKTYCTNILGFTIFFLTIKSASQNITSEDKVYYQIWLPEQKLSNKDRSDYSNLSSALGNFFAFLVLCSFPILDIKKSCDNMNSDIVLPSSATESSLHLINLVSYFKKSNFFWLYLQCHLMLMGLSFISFFSLSLTFLLVPR